MTGERLRALMRLQDVDSMPWLNSTDLRSHYCRWLRTIRSISIASPPRFYVVCTTCQLPFYSDWFNKAWTWCLQCVLARELFVRFHLQRMRWLD
jgi:hypothetical protein